MSAFPPSPPPPPPSVVPAVYLTFQYACINYEVLSLFDELL